MFISEKVVFETRIAGEWEGIFHKNEKGQSLRKHNNPKCLCT